MTDFRGSPGLLGNLIYRLRLVEAAVFKAFDGSGRPTHAHPRASKFGTGTIASGSTSVTITHGAPYTPTIDMIHVMPSNNPTNDPAWLWISTITSTQFNVNCRADPGAGGLTFGWAVVPV